MSRVSIGTKSVLFGAHCFVLHPWFVAWAWWKLYGFPWDPRLWVAFFVHDLGYIGKPNMDGPEGETHPRLGARIMSLLFDWRRGFRFSDGGPIAYRGKMGRLRSGCAVPLVRGNSMPELNHVTCPFCLKNYLRRATDGRIWRREEPPR